MNKEPLNDLVNKWIYCSKIDEKCVYEDSEAGKILAAKDRGRKQGLLACAKELHKLIDLLEGDMNYE